jgi:hypothetical protein
MRATAPVGEEQEIFIVLMSLMVGLRNYQWKHISTGDSVYTTAGGNRVVFPLAVLLHQPTVKFV